MCTLIVAWQVFDDAPVVAAANRDEVLGRPSRSPGVLDREPSVVAPQDEEAGGTWIGYNDRDLFVAITNRRVEGGVDRRSEGGDVEERRSRGLLVRDALGRGSVAETLREVERELATHRYDGFNLLLADDGEATLLEWDGTLRSTSLDPGIHVIVNEGVNDAAPKARRIRTAVHPAPGEDVSLDDWRERAKAVLRDHDLGACVHGEGFGTRSSSIVTLRVEGESTYEFADGPPCETAYETVEGHL